MFKTLVVSLLFFKSFLFFGQDTTYSIKSINKDRIVKGYLVVKFIDNKVISTERISSFKSLEKINPNDLNRKRIKIKKIPKDKLEPKEYLKNRLLDNGL